MYLKAIMFSWAGNRNQSLQRSRRTETLWIPPWDEKVSARLVKRFNDRGGAGQADAGEKLSRWRGGVKRLGESEGFVTGSQAGSTSCEGQPESTSRSLTEFAFWEGRRLTLMLELRCLNSGFHVYFRYVSISSLSFSADAHFLCASSNTETVHIFKLEPHSPW